jgi:sucrose-phosphate synthase
VRKNISTLVRAYAENPQLRDMANLVIIAGSREDIMLMEKGPRRVLSELLLLIDHYDLYGQIAYPKKHAPDEVPDIYRLVARSRGIFVNPALTEPFGLTLLEAAATGLPIIATEDGGPKDIIANCNNGELINPLDPDEIGEVLVSVIANDKKWKKWSRAGIEGTRKHYAWETHVERYLDKINQVKTANKRTQGSGYRSYRSRLPTSDRMLVCDIDNTLIGDKDALDDLLRRLNQNGQHIGFGVATGRRLESAVEIVKEWNIPTPDFFITSVGCEIYYGKTMREDRRWKHHINYRWDPTEVCKATAEIPGLRLQPTSEQRMYKVSYYYNPKVAPSVSKIVRYLRQKDIHVNAVYSHQMFLDFLPVRASKGAALRYFADKWGVPVEHILVAGDSGNDMEMLSGETLGVVVGNHSAELKKLRGRERVFFADGQYARGIIEGIEYYDFLGSIRIPGRGNED